MRIFVIGATGSGKSDFGIKLCQKLKTAEIVNSDALQLYKALSIGTAKVPFSQRRGVAHHMIDVADGLHDVYSVRRYAREASAAVAEVEGRGNTPVVVGGSLYYVESLLLKGATYEDDSAASESCFREEEDNVESLSPEEAFAELEKIDPETASKFLISDVRRVKNALAHARRSGTALSAAARERTLRHPESVVFWMRPPFTSSLTTKATTFEEDPEKTPEYRNALKTRIESMLEEGLLEEAESFLKATTNKSATAGVSQAIGYREFEPYFNGNASLDECVETLTTKHVQYGKYQLKWIRKRLLSKGARVLEIRDKGAELLSIPNVFDAIKSGKALEGAPLVSKSNSSSMNEHKKFVCQVCRLTVVGESTWKSHILGKKHRKKKNPPTKRFKKPSPS